MQLNKKDSIFNVYLTPLSIISALFIIISKTEKISNISKAMKYSKTMNDFFGSMMFCSLLVNWLKIVGMLGYE